MSKVNNYKKAGVNINAGNLFVKKIKRIILSTHIKGTIKNFGLFGGFFDISKLNYKKPILVSSVDGVGTKIKIAQELNKYDTIGVDLVAMCMNDILVHGAKPIFFLDYIATNKLNIRNAQKIINGISKGCMQAKCSLLGGETAEMPGIYKKNDFDLAGFGVGIIEKKNLITGQNIKSGDIVIGLKSSGFHSNGFSLIRHILKKKKISYNIKVNSKIKNLGQFLIKPTKIYSKIILSLTKKKLLNGISHITGGGIIENLPRVIPKGLSVDFKNHNWKLPYIFKWISEKGNIKFNEMLRVFNCGIGMTIFCSSKKLNIIQNILSNQKENYIYLGRVTKNRKKIQLKNLKESWKN